MSVVARRVLFNKGLSEETFDKMTVFKRMEI